MQSTEDALVSIVQSRRVRRWFWAIVLLVMLFVVIRSSVIDVNEVPSASMLPAIKPGDRILINKLAYDLKFPLTKFHLVHWSEPRVGEIVVFISPMNGLRLVKRVVAVGGDRVTMVGDRLCIGGNWCNYTPDGDRWIEKTASESCMILAKLDGDGPLASVPPITIPQNMYYVMGDNRDDSADSRVFGPVPRSAILGRVIRSF